MGVEGYADQAEFKCEPVELNDESGDLEVNDESAAEDVAEIAPEAEQRGWKAAACRC